MSKILYIEDNPLNMRLVRKLVNSFGFDFVEALDGLTGLQMAADSKPDLILVDINLPDIDGLEVTRRLKETDMLKDVPVVALTANAMHGDRERCLTAGCDGYLAKPIVRMELRGVLEQFLSGARPDAKIAV